MEQTNTLYCVRYKYKKSDNQCIKKLNIESILDDSKSNSTKIFNNQIEQNYAVDEAKKK